jgi:uncharacterized protein YjbI with pentapeptide repeats
VTANKLAFPLEPTWLTCQRALGPPCIGIQIRSRGGCLEHLTSGELAEFLAELGPGADLDVRGTTIAASLFKKLSAAFLDTSLNRPVFGDARFELARISRASFASARFRGGWFNGARFEGVARFGAAVFDGDADFSDVRFDGDADFRGARFDGDVRFGDTWFGGTASFDRARFDTAQQFGLVRAEVVSLDRAEFARLVEVQIEAHSVSCDGTRFDDGVTLRVRYGTVSAAGAAFGAASSIGNSTAPYNLWADESAWLDELTERPGGSRTSDPMVMSLRGADVSNLVLTDVDLSRCEFAGAHRLDQLRVEGRCEFGVPPSGWWWTRRQMLAEEAEWRGQQGRVGPERLAALYRSLRKAFEDSKNEAGAGDFYYGEMEMRRHSASTRRTERGILWVYWALSGYGQRAGRALVALLVLIATVAVLLAIWGQSPGEAAQIAVGAVVLRDPGTKLTEAGQWTVMVARVLGPVLLALAVLAVRARVKR